MKNIFRNLLVLASSTVVASGCTSIMKKNEAQADADIKKTEQIYASAEIKKPESLVTVTKQVYLSGKSFKIEHIQELPPLFKKHVTYTAGSGENSVQVIDNIGKMLGLDVRVSEDAAAKLTKSTSDAVKSLKSYDGTLSKILSEIVSKEGLYWNYQNGILKIFQVETTVYSLDAPISTYAINNTISSTANSGSNDTQGSGSTNGNSAMNMNYAVKAVSAWDAAVSTIKNMMSPAGRLDTNPVEGYVTVTDTPDHQRAINTYISKINAKTGKKIAIRVDVYDVQNSSGGSFGIDPNVIIRAFGGQAGWVGASLATVGDSGDTPGAIKFVEKNGDPNHPTAVFNALNTIGKTTQVTGTTIYTISGQPAPVQNSIQTNYLKSITNTQANGITTSSAETGTINTGYSMMITPRIESDNQVLISLNLQISNLVRIDNYPIGGGSSPKGLLGADNNNQTIQLPVVHTKNFLENMILKSGQSILIAGFQDGGTNIKTNSMGDPSMWLLGGSKATNQTKSTTVVVVTPYLIS